jgi:L-fucose isomerase-like protein
MKKIDDQLRTLQKQIEFAVEFKGGELVRTAEDMPKFLATVKDVDGILAFNLTSGCGPMFTPIVEQGIPTLLFSQPYSGHDWSTVADMQKKGKKVEVISSSDIADLIPALRILAALQRTKSTNILCLRPNLEKGAGILDLEHQFGLKISLMDYAELNSLYKKADEKTATKLADAFIAGAQRMVEPTRQDVIDSMKLYLAIQELLAKYNSEVITIDCLGGFKRKDLPAYPCVSWTMLNNSDRIGVCEADLTATVTQVLLQYLSGKPGFVSDPVIDTKTNTVIHAHCVSATKMDGPNGPAAPYIIRTHMEDNQGVAVQVKMRLDQDITLAKLADAKTMLISTGKIIDNPDVHRGCRTKITTQVADADKMLHHYAGGLHRLIFYGHWVADVKKMGRLAGFEVVEEI